jgi:hypothetical protein
MRIVFQNKVISQSKTQKLKAPVFLNLKPETLFKVNKMNLIYLQKSKIYKIVLNKLHQQLNKEILKYLN